MKAYIKGYNLTDFFAGKIRIDYGKVEEIGSNYVIAKGALSYTGEQNWYTNVHSNGWVEFRFLSPIYLKAGTTYTLSYDITLLETIDGKTAFTAAAHNFGKSYIYSLKNTLDKQHVVFRRTFDSDTVLSNTTNTFNITTNSLHVKIENLMIVEGEEEKPYDNGRIRVKPVIPVRNPKNLIPFPYYSKPSNLVGSGVEAVINDDGSVTFNGTATKETSFVWYLGGWNADSGFQLDGGSYTYSGVIGGSSTTYYTQAYINGKSRPTQTNSPTTIKVSDGDYLNRLTMFIKPGAVFDNLTIYPMFVKGDTEQPYFAPQKCNIFIKE